MPYVYSTATCAGTYCDYGPTNEHAGHSTIRRKVTIKGGHGVASPFRGANTAQVFTPYGVATEVTEAELEFLKSNKSFQRHVAAGFITYEEKKKVDPGKQAANMAQKDGSAPLTPKDFEESEHSTPDARIYKKKAPEEQYSEGFPVEPTKTKGKK